MHVGIPQAIWLVVVLTSLGVNLAQTASKKTDKVTWVIATLLVTAFNLLIPAWGGFFK